MKYFNILILSMIALGVITPSPAMEAPSFQSEIPDSRVDSLRARFPLLFIDMKSELFEADTSGKGKLGADAVQRESIIDKIVEDSIVVLSNSDSVHLKALAQKAERNASDKLYLRNKPALDEARSKYFLTPYHSNYAYFSWIDDPSREGDPVGGRYALKFQISQKYPLITTRRYTNGLYFAMTFRGLFDVLDGETSKPVTKKTFMPEGFLKIDLGTLHAFYPRLLSEQSDKSTIQLGTQHESNGGYINSFPLFSSRSIKEKRYAQFTYKFRKADTTSGLVHVYSNKFKGYFKVRLNWLKGVSENKDIQSFIGYSELSAGYEKIYFGLWQLEGWLAPGNILYHDYHGISYWVGCDFTLPWDRLDSKPMARIPLTMYVKYFNGFNEFLETYNTKTKFIGFGFKLRG